jgi:hypothetical protein
MNTGEKIYEHIVNNESIIKDYFENYEEENSNYKLEHLFHTFINESVLADSAKMKLLKIIDKRKKRTIFEYFDMVQSEFNILFYNMKI